MEVQGDGYWIMVKEYQAHGCPHYYWVWCGRDNMNEEIDISNDVSEISCEEESESIDENVTDDNKSFNREVERLEISYNESHSLNDNDDFGRSNIDEEIEEVN